VIERQFRLLDFLKDKKTLLFVPQGLIFILQSNRLTLAYGSKDWGNHEVEK
jgi:hypothetical protein